jgi:hypothetical protein
MSNSQPNDGSDGFNLEFAFYLSGVIGDRFCAKSELSAYLVRIQPLGEQTKYLEFSRGQR